LKTGFGENPSKRSQQTGEALRKMFHGRPSLPMGLPEKHTHFAKEADFLPIRKARNLNLVDEVTLACSAGMRW
jgi:hypothetical protein